jgi:hypothetical protein
MTTPPALAALQRMLQEQVLHGNGDVRPWIDSPLGIPAEQRLGVYDDAYRLRLVEVLGNDYRGLAALLGEEGFAGVGAAYVAAHPSDTRSVRWFGRHLAAFLRTREPDQPLLAELAAFEWAQGEAFDAADAEPLAMERIAAVAPEHWPHMRFTLHPSVRRLALHGNVPPMWQALTRGTTVPPASAAPDPVEWLLWRQGLEVHWRMLGADEATILDAVRAGADFGWVCGHLHEHGHEDEEAAALAAAGMLKRWLADGLVTGLSGTGT